MKYNYKPRPQKYNGRVYRSGLEAKYARLFDAIGLTYIYEPTTELDGWLPDFMIIDQLGNIWFVEIKPISMVDTELKAKMMRAMNNGLNAIILSESPNLHFKTAFGESPIHDQNFTFEYEGGFYRDFGHAAMFTEIETGKIFIESCTNTAIYKDGKLHADLQNISIQVADYWNTIQNKTMYLRPLNFTNYGKGA